MRTPFPPGVLAVALTAACVPVLAACGSDSDAPSAPAFTRTDSAGVVLAVTTYATPSPTPSWTIDEAAQIRYGESSAEPLNFVWIRNATRLPDGRVAALDPRVAELLVFAPSGELAARAGREGDGPGEFKRPSGLVHVGGDTLLVYDASHMRFSLFDTQGNFLDESRLEAPGGGEDAPRLPIYGMVDVVGDTVTLRGEGYSFSSAATGDYVFENPTLRYTTAGTFIDEVAEPMSARFYATSNGPRTKLFQAWQQVTGRDGLVYIGDPDRYEVRVYDPPNGMIRIERLERRRRPVTDETMDALRAEVADNIDDPERRKQALEEWIGKSPVADSMSWINGLTVDALGNVWVHEYSYPGEDSDAMGVFSAEGEWLGMMHLPQGFRPLEIGGDYILGALTDELDVPHLVSYDLIREPPAMETAADQAAR